MALTDNLLAYWKLDESSGDAADATGNGHTAANENTATYVTGKINNGVALNGTNQFLIVYNSTRAGIPVDLGSFASTGMYSFSAWIKTTQSSPAAPYSWTTGAVLMEARTYPTEGEYGWAFGLSSNKLATAAASNGTSQSVSATTTLNDGNWHHVAVVVNTSSITFYIDGISDGTATFAIGNDRSLSSGTGTDAAVVIGTRTQDQGPIGANLFAGDIDELAMWNRALSSSEVSQLYNSGAGLQYPFGTTHTLTLTETVGASDTLVKKTVKVLAEAISTIASIIAAKNGVIQNGPMYGSTSVDGGTTSAGGTIYEWTNTGNLYADDGALASALAVASESGETGQLTTTGFGFSIPTSAIIKGIQMEVKRKASANDATHVMVDSSVKLTKAGTAVGNDKADTTTEWTTSLTVKTYGSSTDLWGATWTASDINNSNFGTYFGARTLQSSSVTASVDYIRLTVFYSLGTAWTKALTETVTVADTLFRSITKKFAETLSAAASLIRTTSRTLLEIVGADDTLRRTTGRTFTEKIGLSDTFTSFTGKVKTLTEAITATDTFTRLLQWTRTLTESTTTSDTLSANSVLPRSFTEAVTAAATLTKTATKVLTEAVIASASLIRSIARTLSESVTAADNKTIVKFIGQELSEAVSAADTLTRSITRTLAETVSTAASFIVSKVFNRTYSEAATATDTVEKSTGRNLIETITASDALSRVWTISRTLSERVYVVDILKKLRNGLDTFLKNTSKISASLKNIVKRAASSLTNTSRNSTDLRNIDKQ